MSDSTNISVFGQETYFNEKINAFSGIETPNLKTDDIKTKNFDSTNLNSSVGTINTLTSTTLNTTDINISGNINNVSIIASNAYGTRYVSVASTPSNNSVGSNGDVWYTI